MPLDFLTADAPLTLADLAAAERAAFAGDTEAHRLACRLLAEVWWLRARLVARATAQ